MPILVVVEDLFFLSKIREAAKVTSVDLEVVRPDLLKERLTANPAAAVICDLNYRAGLALDAVRELKRDELLRSIPVIGFVSHVQSDLISAAREAGCDIVMARSAFTLKLRDLLLQYSARDRATTSHSPTGNAS